MGKKNIAFADKIFIQHIYDWVYQLPFKNILQCCTFVCISYAINCLSHKKYTYVSFKEDDKYGYDIIDNYNSVLDGR